MSAPTLSTRQTPEGKFLEDGYQSLITFERKPNVSLWEKTVKPPGADGGDGIDITTMHNQVWRTKTSRALITLTDNNFTAAYDPAVMDDLVELINAEGSITVLFSDGTTETYYGYLKSFEPGDLKEGEFPEASCTIVPTNRDPVAKTEQGPVIVSVEGT